MKSIIDGDLNHTIKMSAELLEGILTELQLMYVICNNSEANKIFNELCKMRRQGRLRAIGHYGSASLHIGVGDRVANTWRKSCP